MVLQHFGIDALRMTSVAQQWVLHCGLWYNDQARVAGMLGADGEIKRWVSNRDTWPPSWVVVLDKLSGYHICFEGSTNFQQFGLHALGVFFLEDGIEGAEVNGQWWEQQKALAADIKQVVPSGLGRDQLHFTGHSYGGAIAQLMACDWLNQGYCTGCQLMTSGAPAAMSEGYAGRLPAPYWRLDSDEDIVPYLPPPALLYALALRRDPSQFFTGLKKWQHYGDRMAIYPNGAVNEAEPVAYPLPEWVSLDIFESHMHRNYVGRCAEWNRRFGVA